MTQSVTCPFLQSLLLYSSTASACFFLTSVLVHGLPSLSTSTIAILNFGSSIVRLFTAIIFYAYQSLLDLAFDWCYSVCKGPSDSRVGRGILFKLAYRSINHLGESLPKFEPLLCCLPQLVGNPLLHLEQTRSKIPYPPRGCERQPWWAQKLECSTT